MIKRFLALTIVFGGFVLLTACESDQCITCSYTDPSLNSLITEPEVCGGKSVLDNKEANAKLAADALMATDFECVRK